MITAEIITIGTEIILGQVVDTNARYIAKALLERGISVLFQTSVGDDKELLKSVLSIAVNRVNLIITTGGLGPTANDITREAVSDFIGVPLVSDEDSYGHIRKFMESQRREMMDEHKKQATIPEGAVVIHNGNGTATGFAIQHGGTEVVCLPGVPGEMQSMLNKYLETRPVQHVSEEGCTVTRNLHTFGISERAVEDALKDCNGHPKIMTLVHDGIVTVNILATAPERESATIILDKAERDIREKLGHAVFGAGDETLEYAVAVLLKRRNKTIALAESCTGGLVSDKLTNIPGISEFFLEGIVAYSNKAKVDVLGVSEELIMKHGAVSPQVAKAMAEGVRNRSSADIGVGITGIAGPAGATQEKPVGLVYIAVIFEGMPEIKECRLRGSRIDIKNVSAHIALNMVRLKLIDKLTIS